MYKCLLLTSTYQYVNFITDRKAINLMVRDKVEVISNWNLNFSLINKKIPIPSILKLKSFSRVFLGSPRLNRKSLFKRDNFLCQYCGFAGTPNQLTIDHIHPSSKGGVTSWQNCITACKSCNFEKKDKTLEQCGFKLLSKPTIPGLNPLKEMNYLQNKHEDWILYLK